MPMNFSLLNQARDLLPNAYTPQARQFFNQQDAQNNAAVKAIEQAPASTFPGSEPTLRDTIRTAMPGEPQGSPWQAPTQQPGQPWVAPWETPPQQQQPTATPAVPPGQLPQQAALTQPVSQLQEQQPQQLQYQQPQVPEQEQPWWMTQNPLAASSMMSNALRGSRDIQNW